MAMLKKVILFLACLVLVSGLSACRERKVYGEIIAIAEHEITIKTGVYTAPDTDECRSRQEQETKSSTPGSQTGLPGFIPDGETASYRLSKEVDTDDLAGRDLVILTFTGRLISSIEVIPKSTGDDSMSHSASTEASADYIIDAQEKVLVHQNFDSGQADVSALLVKNKSSLELRESGLTKSGNTSNADACNRYGLNAIFLVSGGSTASLKNTTFNSSASGSNAVFATGTGTKISLSQFKIHTTEDTSKGLNATCGGTIIASGGKISTKGSQCAPISTSWKKGTIKVQNTTLSSTGKRSPCIYSVSSVSCSNVTGNARNSPIAVMKGESSVTLKECLLQGDGKNGIVLQQNTSGNTEGGKTQLQIADSKLTTTSKGPMFYISGTDAAATVKNTSLYFSSGILANISGSRSNSGSILGKSGGSFMLKGVRQRFTGDIKCDSDSSVSLALTQKSTFKGAVNNSGKAKSASISLDSTSIWNVTANSHVTGISNKDASCRNILSNGHKIYYDKNNRTNAWLQGKTLKLAGGGKLIPEQV